MVENLNGNLMLDSLLSNFTFRIIPIANPGGYNANSRNNLRNVNINRNFSYGWINSSESVDAPYSEIETQIIHQWLLNNKNAFAYIDHHNFTRNFQVEIAVWHHTIFT